MKDIHNYYLCCPSRIFQTLDNNYMGQSRQSVYFMAILLGKGYRVWSAQREDRVPVAFVNVAKDAM